MAPRGHTAAPRQGVVVLLLVCMAMEPCMCIGLRIGLHAAHGVAGPVTEAEMNVMNGPEMRAYLRLNAPRAFTEDEMSGLSNADLRVAVRMKGLDSSSDYNLRQWAASNSSVSGMLGSRMTGTTTRLCSTAPEIDNGGINTRKLSNYYDGLELQDLITCDEGYFNGGPAYSKCECATTGGQCGALTKACLSYGGTYNPDDYEWMTRRGDPPSDIGSGFFSCAMAQWIISLASWFSTASFFGIAVLRPDDLKLMVVSTQAVFWQFLYSVLVDTCGPHKVDYRVPKHTGRHPDELQTRTHCFKTRIHFNYFVFFALILATVALKAKNRDEWNKARAAALLEEVEQEKRAQSLEEKDAEAGSMAQKLDDLLSGKHSFGVWGTIGAAGMAFNLHRMLTACPKSMGFTGHVARTLTSLPTPKMMKLDFKQS